MKGYLAGLVLVVLVAFVTVVLDVEGSVLFGCGIFAGLMARDVQNAINNRREADRGR